MYINSAYLDEPKARIVKHTYAKGGLCVKLIDEIGEPLANLSIWLPASPSLPKNQFVCKNYSENEGILESLAEQNKIKVVGEEDGLPVCELC